jgi:farnesyl-diphosphate farnesyltransferase
MGALSRPEEVVALVKLRVAAGQIKRQIPPQEHWAFCYDMLQKVSRSFALVIQQLGPELRNAVSPLPLSSPFSFLTPTHKFGPIRD